MTVTRREGLRRFAQIVSVVTAGVAAPFTICEELAAQTVDNENISIETWMDSWMQPHKTPVGALHLSRFVEPIYFLLRPIGWKPSARHDQSLPAVDVPIGFVTDFATIPRIFWRVLRPDGEYTYPAIIHDHLYWQQTVERKIADDIFLAAMEDFSIPTPTALAIYNSVRIGGDSAWSNNANLKKQGERRVLKVFPEDPRTRWLDWKKRRGVFA